jgi:hypothetical protein
MYQSLCPLVVVLAAFGWASDRANCEQRDLARRADPQRWSAETGAPARVELRPLTVPAEALDDRLVEAHQVVERPDLATRRTQLAFVGIRSAKVMAKAFRAGFHLVAHRV